MINYSFYPILSGARRQIKEFDKESILFAQENIEKYTPTRNLDIDIPVWLISTIILHNFGNKFLIRKFVSNYGKLTFESHFRTDINDKDTRVMILEYLGTSGSGSSGTGTETQVMKLSKKEEYVKIHMLDYLEIAQKIENPRFNLMNQYLMKGFVYTPVKTFSYLCRLVVEKILYNKILTEMKDYHDNELINRCVKELKESGRYPENRVKPIQSGTVPQSIQDLITKAYREHHLTHPERRKIGIVLQARGFDIEYIVDIFRQCSDFSEKTTRYQLQSLKKYIKAE